MENESDPQFQVTGLENEVGTALGRFAFGARMADSPTSFHLGMMTYIHNIADYRHKGSLNGIPKQSEAYRSHDQTTVLMLKPMVKIP